MKFTHRMALRAGAAAFALSTAFLGSSALAADNTWDDVMERGFVRVGIIADQPCYYWRDNEQSPWKGFPIRFSEDATAWLEDAMETDLDIEYVPTSWSTVVLDIQSSKIDMFMGMGFTEERQRAINMFGPIYGVPEVAVTRKGFELPERAEGESTLDSLNKPGIRISVVMGTTEEQDVMNHAPNATLRSLKTQGDTILDVQSGNSDVIMMTIVNALFAVDANDNLADPVLKVPYVAPASGGGTRKDDDDRFYEALQAWSEDFRGSGRVKEAIVGALGECGIDMSRLPADATF